ncbi:MAG TPA: hypothetical protein VJN29_04630 [Intrasporangium sp.]|nr:hypothetical protein [Intrasporangium sp.]
MTVFAVPVDHEKRHLEHVDHDSVREGAYHARSSRLKLVHVVIGRG